MADSVITKLQFELMVTRRDVSEIKTQVQALEAGLQGLEAEIKSNTDTLKAYMEMNSNRMDDLLNRLRVLNGKPNSPPPPIVFTSTTPAIVANESVLESYEFGENNFVLENNIEYEETLGANMFDKMSERVKAGLFVGKQSGDVMEAHQLFDKMSLSNVPALDSNHTEEALVALYLFDEMSRNDVFNELEGVARQSYDPGIGVENAQLINHEKSSQIARGLFVRRQDYEVMEAHKLFDESPRPVLTANFEVTSSILFLIESVNWCSVQLLSPRLVVRCHCEMVTWPTGIGTNLSNFEFYMHEKCAKWLPWYRKSEIAVKYDNRLNVGMLKHKKKMEFVSIHGMIDDDTKEKDARDSWLELNVFYTSNSILVFNWFYLVYNNLGDKVDFQEVGNRVYSVLPENGHIRSYIGNIRSGDDEISVNLNRGGVKGIIMFSKDEVELIGNDVILRMSNAWSKCDKMDIWYFEVVEGLDPMLLAKNVIEESNEKFLDAFHGGKEACTSAFKMVDKEIKPQENVDCFGNRTTTVLVLKQGGGLVVTNLVDSRVVLGRVNEEKELEAVQLIIDLNSNEASKVEKIRKCNGSKVGQLRIWNFYYQEYRQNYMVMMENEVKTMAYSFINDKFYEFEAPRVWATGNLIRK